jgi:hypothetical protein
MDSHNEPAKQRNLPVVVDDVSATFPQHIVITRRSLIASSGASFSECRALLALSEISISLTLVLPSFP